MSEPLTTQPRTLEEAQTKIDRLTGLLQETTLRLDQARIQVSQLTEQNTQFQVALMKERSRATTTIAAAGIDPLVEAGGSNPLAEEINPAQGQTGLKRAIAAAHAQAKTRTQPQF